MHLFPDLAVFATPVYSVSFFNVGLCVGSPQDKEMHAATCVYVCYTLFNNGCACWFLLLLDHVETFIYSGTIGNNAV